MIILYIFILLTLNFSIYNITKWLKYAKYQIIFTVLLIIIKKLIGSVEDELTSLLGILFFSIAIPFFSFCFTLMKNTKKKLNKNLQLKIVNYLKENNYVSHITIFFTFYQLFLLLTEIVHWNKVIQLPKTTTAKLEYANRSWKVRV